MTRRSPRAGGSSQERPRLAGKEPGAYRATTMFVHLANKLARMAWSVLAHGRTFEVSKTQAGVVSSPDPPPLDRAGRGANPQSECQAAER